MNVLTVHADRGILCLLRSMHSGVTTGQGKNGNIYTIDAARLPRPNRLNNPPSSDQHRKGNSLEKTQRISLFQAIHQDRLSD